MEERKSSGGERYMIKSWQKTTPPKFSELPSPVISHSRTRSQTPIGYSCNSLSRRTWLAWKIRHMTHKQILILMAGSSINVYAGNDQGKTERKVKVTALYI